MSLPCITRHQLTKCTGTEIHLNGGDKQLGSGKGGPDNEVDNGMHLCLRVTQMWKRQMENEEKKRKDKRIKRTKYCRKKECFSEEEQFFGTDDG